MTKANTCVSLINVDFKSTYVHKCLEEVDVGITAKFGMQELVKKNKLMIFNG